MPTTLFITGTSSDGSPALMIESAEFIPNVGDTVDSKGMEWVVVSRKFDYTEREDTRHTVSLTVEPIQRK
jgi:chitodextrinase